MTCCRQPTARPALTVASYTASAEADAARRQQQQSARIETLELQVVRLQAEVARLKRLIQPINPALVDQLEYKTDPSAT